MKEFFHDAIYTSLYSRHSCDVSEEIACRVFWCSEVQTNEEHSHHLQVFFQ